MIQQNMTKLASIATRSTATQTTNSVTDWSSLQLWRSIQGDYWLELQRPQHFIQQILEQSRDSSRNLPDRTPTGVLEQQRDRIRRISLDMNALNKSCSVEMATCSAPLSPRRPAFRLRALCSATIMVARPPQKGGSNKLLRKGRAEISEEGGGLRKEPAVTIEESSSVHEVDARRKRPRSS